MDSQTEDKQIHTVTWIGTSNDSDASAAVRQGNWWCPGESSNLWLALDVLREEKVRDGRRGPDVTAMKIRATNREATPKDIRVEYFEEDESGESLTTYVTNKDWLSKHPDAEDVKGRWEEAVKATMEQKDQFQEFRFSQPIQRRFWRFFMESNYGKWYTGINDIHMMKLDDAVDFLKVPAVQQAMSHQSILLYGVPLVPRCGTPGTIAIFGPTSFAVCGTYGGDSGWAALAGATTYGAGEGRIVVFGHSSYIGNHSDSKDGTRRNQLNRILRNAFLWVGKDHRTVADLSVFPYFESPEGVQLPSDRALHFGRHGSIRVGGLGISAKDLTAIVDELKLTEKNAQGVKAVEIVHCETDASEDQIDAVLNAGVDVLYWCSNRAKTTLLHKPVDRRVAKVLNFVASGGGIVGAMTPWGWGQLAGANVLTENLQNEILRHTGLYFTDGYAPSGDLPCDKKARLRSIQDNVIFALQCLESHQGEISEEMRSHLFRGMAALPHTVTIGDESENEPYMGYQRAASLESGLVDVSEECGQILRRFLRKHVTGAPGGAAACDMEELCLRPPQGLAYPICCGEATDAAAVARIMWLTNFDRMWRKCSSGKCPKAPKIKRFPRKVPKDAQPVSQMRTQIVLGMPGWQSTGLFAKAGTAIVLQIPFESLQQIPPSARLTIRIGCHSDRLPIVDSENRRYKLSRWPQITSATVWDPSLADDVECQEGGAAGCRGDTAVAANPFGGLIYLEYSGPDVPMEPVVVEISHAYLAPWLHLPVESNAMPYAGGYPFEELRDWQQRVNTCPAPWGELQGHYVVIALPKPTLKKLKSLEQAIEVIRFWDEVCRLELALCGQTLKRPERLVPDIQISAGYMHAGYPIMTHMDVAECDNPNELPEILDVATLRTKGSWGFFHEMGHNRQCSEWTFGGTGEVTVNIFSLYVCNMILGKSPYKTDWLGNQLKGALEYLKSDTQTFQNDWKSKPGLALVSYAGIIERFGWDLVSNVFTKYRMMPDSEKPRDDSDKITQWIIHTSLESGHNLTPYYAQWKWPTKSEKLNSLSHLPSYNPNLVEELEAAIKGRR